MRQLKATQIIRPHYIISALILFFFGKNIFPTNDNFIGGLDIPYAIYWNLHFIKEQFLSGSIPLWNPYQYCGHPFMADPATFVFYPSTLLYLALPFPWAFNLDTLLHFYLAAMGIYYFAFTLTKSKSAGLAAAIVYSLSGYFMDRLFAGHLLLIRSAAVLPWIFYFIEKAFKTERSVFFLVSGMVLGLQILNGNAQDSFYTALFVTVYFLIRYFFTPESFRVKEFFRFGIYFLMIPVLAFGVSAIQILPSLEFLSYSDRAKNTYEFAAFYSFPPQNFFTFLVPKARTALLDTNYEFGAYLGILSIPLAGIGGIFCKQRHYAWCFCIMLIIAMTVMLGHYTPVYHFYYKWLPGISTFRVPARCLVIFVFSMAILVSFGVQHLSESPLTKKQHCVLMFGLIILFLCLFSGAKVFQVPLASREILLAICLIISASVVLNLIRFLRNKYTISGLIIAALFIDLYLIYPSQIPKLNENDLLRKHDFERMFEKDPGFYRVGLPLDFGTNRGSKFHYYGVNGYTSIALNDYYHFIHDMANLPIPTLGRYTLSSLLFQPNLVFSSKILGIKYAIAKTQSGYQLLSARHVMPRSVLVRDAIILPQEEHLEYVKRPDFDPKKQVLLEAAALNYTPSISESNKSSAKEDIIKIVQYFPNRIELKSVSGISTYLVLSELFYPGWYAYVDGKDVPILRANYLLRAIPLTPGQHEIVFVYRPNSFFVGAALSLLTIFVLVSVYLFCYRNE